MLIMILEKNRSSKTLALELGEYGITVNNILPGYTSTARLKDLAKSKQIEWCWIKGHSDDPMNDLADKLAKEATPI